MNHIIIQAYGKTSVINEARLLILSILCYAGKPEDFQISVFTDKPQDFGPLSQHLVFIPAEKEIIRKWRGEINFVHRVKIELLREFAGKNEGKMIYLDSDCLLLGDVNNLFEQINDSTVLMHESEGRLCDRSNPLIKKMYRFTQRNAFTITNKTVKIPDETIMYNAGVIGANVYELRKFTNKILMLTDQMHTVYPKHVSEQLAFSFYLQNNFNIREAKPQVQHYWRNCHAFEAQIANFFSQHENEPIERQLEAFKNLELKEAEPKPSFLRRVLSSVFK